MNKDLEMAKKIALNVNKLGGKTYFVGGYVRDKILGLDNKDIDIEVHGISPEKLKSMLETLGTVKAQGASFGVYNLHGFDIDIAQPRMESAIGRGHKDFEVTVDPYIGTTKAAKRRDFTINSIMQDVLTEEIIDPFNGLDDLKHNIIRHVDDKSFGEDPLRVLRAAQFAARFNFNIAPETLNIMSKMDLSTLSKERIYCEMKKALLKANKPSIFFEVLRNVNQLDVWFPELKNLINCNQNPEFHPEGDVWTHTMMVVDYAATIKKDTSNEEYFMVASLLHDIGKPLSITIKNNIIHSYNHETIGLDVAKIFLNRLNNDVALNKYVMNMIENHMKPHILFNNNCKKKNTNRLFDKCISPNDICKLAIADSSSKNNPLLIKEEEQFLKERLNIYLDRIKEPEVTGKDLILLGIKPGPIFTQILEEAHKKHLAFVDKDTVLKDIKTRYCN